MQKAEFMQKYNQKQMLEQKKGNAQTEYAPLLRHLTKRRSFGDLIGVV